MGKVELTPAKLAIIRQKAEAAEKESPSPWHGGPDGLHWVLVDSEQGDIHTSCNQRNTAEFIAHADPATVLAMVEEIERLRPAQCWVIMRKDNRDQVFDGPFFTEEDAWLHLPESVDYEYTVEPWANQANVIESEASQ